MQEIPIVTGKLVGGVNDEDAMATVGTANLDSPMWVKILCDSSDNRHTLYPPQLEPHLGKEVEIVMRIKS